MRSFLRENRESFYLIGWKEERENYFDSRNESNFSIQMVGSTFFSERSTMFFFWEMRSFVVGRISSYKNYYSKEVTVIEQFDSKISLKEIDNCMIWLVIYSHFLDDLESLRSIKPYHPSRWLLKLLPKI